MNFTITVEVQTDIESIWLYTFKNWSIEQADRYYNIILDEIEYLAKNPESGKDYSHVRKGYYRSKVKMHFIFYRINKNEIEIIRVLHEQMDIDSRLK